MKGMQMGACMEERGHWSASGRESSNLMVMGSLSIHSLSPSHRVVRGAGCMHVHGLLVTVQRDLHECIREWLTSSVWKNEVDVSTCSPFCSTFGLMNGFVIHICRLYAPKPQ